MDGVCDIDTMTLLPHALMCAAIVQEDELTQLRRTCQVQQAGLVHLTTCLARAQADLRSAVKEQQVAEVTQAAAVEAMKASQQSAEKTIRDKESALKLVDRYRRSEALQQQQAVHYPILPQWQGQ